MPVNGGPRRTEAKRANTYRTVPRQTTVHTELAVADEQLESLGADIFALKMLFPALLSRVGRLDPILASAIHHGFQDATNQVEHLMAASRKSRTTPLARRFEIWIPDEARGSLIFQSGDCDQNPHLAEEHKSAVIAKGDGTIGRVWQSGVAAVRANLPDDTSAAGRSASAANLSAMVAVPFMNGQRVFRSQVR
jgi:hypothetical protein